MVIHFSSWEGYRHKYGTNQYARNNRCPCMHVIHRYCLLVDGSHGSLAQPMMETYLCDLSLVKASQFCQSIILPDIVRAMNWRTFRDH